MPLSWNEIRGRALAFSNEWAEARSESADAKPFWDAFFHVFGITRRRVASFEQRVHTDAANARVRGMRATPPHLLEKTIMTVTIVT
ncbi:MAG: hypothetical protein OD918_03295 [Gammaproteobacteria bacterium]